MFERSELSIFRETNIRHSYIQDQVKQGSSFQKKRFAYANRPFPHSAQGAEGVREKGAWGKAGGGLCRPLSVPQKVRRVRPCEKNFLKY
ncbi:hypothetical protein HMPREF3200_01712 [Anaerococcus tetradius]|uniref:Uncharacterized protein n=1 Tax=Anaerococcus tetradius TaxID=33036 RepID=A0A133KB57_9FIRM|nr:hypothetical protein HMPREF3200_01712 [Anaerococcus tetradius]